MITQTLNNNRGLHTAPGFYFLLALSLLTLPLKWCLAAGVAGLFHELCHLATLRLCGGKILAGKVGVRGTEIQATPLSAGKSLLCALAGPAGSFFLLLFSARAPQLAVCAAAQGIYNLLPLCSLDGGQALEAALSLLFSPQTVSRICRGTDRLCRIALLILGMYASFFLDLGILPLLLSGIICMKDHGRKISCK